MDESRMDVNGIPLGVIDWNALEPDERPGETGVARRRTRTFGPLRVRMVEYSPGYCADQWRFPGDLLLCLGGELRADLKDGRTFVLKPGMTYRVTDGAETHRSRTDVGARLFILD